jgi:hypothetical protein
MGHQVMGRQVMDRLVTDRRRTLATATNPFARGVRDAVARLGHAPSSSEQLRKLACAQAFVLAVLDSRNLLFSADAQAVYELDDFSAHLWRSFSSGLSDEAIAREIGDSAGTVETVHRMIAASAEQLLESLTSMPNGKAAESKGVADPLTHLTLGLAGVSVRLNLCQSLLPAVEAAFGSLKCNSNDPSISITARAAGGLVQMHVDGRPVSSCDRSEFVPLVKAVLIDSVLKWASYEVALHAAVLECGAGTVLLVGSPGAGKTTLATALVRRGFRIAADDVALLDENGRLAGLLLPFTVKEGAWPMLSPDWPALATEPIYRRPDGIRVRYLQNFEFAGRRPQRMKFVVLLDRRAGVRTSVRGIGRVTALQALIAEGDARDERLRPAGFRSLVSALNDASCFRLTYSDLAEAARAVTSLGRDKTK